MFRSSAHNFEFPTLIADHAIYLMLRSEDKVISNSAHSRVHDCIKRLADVSLLPSRHVVVCPQFLSAPASGLTTPHNQIGKLTWLLF
jgi:hypothetical protein